MTSVLARYLTDFGAGDEARSDARQPVPADALPPIDEAEPAIDVEAERRAAYEDGRQAGAEAARAEHEDRLRELAARHQDEISRLKRRYQAELAEQLARRFEAMRGELGGEIGRQAAEVLAPFVEQAIGQSMVRCFADAVVDALGDGATTSVTVRGPAYLFGFLKGLPAVASLKLEHVETEELDLSTEIDGSTLATRLKALTESLQEGAA